MSIRFGTDGVRGRAHTDLTTDDAWRIARAAAQVFAAEPDAAVWIGTDTRESGPEFVDALARGFVAGGMIPHLLGVTPTPAVAHISQMDHALGAMVSASHNPWFDNGIKLFAPGGAKLSDAQQHELEAAIDALSTTAIGDASAPNVVDGAVRQGDYTAMVRSSVAPNALAGMKVVLDAAHGAGSHIAAPVLTDLGADVTVIGNEPDGRNINDGIGSTHPELLGQTVREIGADLGVALDGDADRLVAVDGSGEVVDGDFVIAICAIDRKERNALAGDTVVVTVMTNLGFRLAMSERGIKVAETAVGDRYVLESLEANGWTLGGEQSGHVIFRDIATTGDGLLTAVQLLDTVNRSGRPIADLAADAMTRLPQVLRNVAVAEKRPDIAELVAAEIAEAESSLGDTGRVLIRPSGTEPVVRVMVEAPTADLASTVCEQLVQSVQARCG